MQTNFLNEDFIKTGSFFIFSAQTPKLSEEAANAKLAEYADLLRTLGYEVQFVNGSYFGVTELSLVVKSDNPSRDWNFIEFLAEKAEQESILAGHCGVFYLRNLSTEEVNISGYVVCGKEALSHPGYTSTLDGTFTFTILDLF